MIGKAEPFLIDRHIVAIGCLPHQSKLFLTKPDAAYRLLPITVNERESENRCADLHGLSDISSMRGYDSLGAKQERMRSVFGLCGID